MKELRNKIISFKSVVINNTSNVYNMKNKNEPQKNNEDNINQKEANNSVIKEKKIKKFFCCL